MSLHNHHHLKVTYPLTSYALKDTSVKVSESKLILTIVEEAAAAAAFKAQIFRQLPERLWYIPITGIFFTLMLDNCVTHLTLKLLHYEIHTYLILESH